jgi:poly(3-hydroxybutyrate) depolymerase
LEDLLPRRLEHDQLELFILDEVPAFGRIEILKVSQVRDCKEESSTRLPPLQQASIEHVLAQCALQFRHIDNGKQALHLYCNSPVIALGSKKLLRAEIYVQRLSSPLERIWVMRDRPPCLDQGGFACIMKDVFSGHDAGFAERYNSSFDYVTQTPWHPSRRPLRVASICTTVQSMKRFTALMVLLLFHGHWAAACANASTEYLLGAQEHFTRSGHLRYLVLLPRRFDPHAKHEIWVNLHGSPGCASHAIFQYRQEALARGAILVAPEATEGAGEFYTLKEGVRCEYHLWDMRRDVDHVLAVIDEAVSRYNVDPRRIVLLGFSAGCEMGWRLIAARPDQFCFFGGIANRFKHGKPPASQRALRIAARHVPHFYAAGQADPFAGPYFKATAARLRGYGFELRTAFPTGVGHDLPASIKAPLIAFLDEVRGRFVPLSSRRVGTVASKSRRRSTRVSAALLVPASGVILVIVLGILRRYRGTPHA